MSDQLRPDNNFPLVSIVTPCLNAANDVRDCIAHVAKQDYPNIEHIIVDGGSKDDTLTVVREIKHLGAGRALKLLVGPDSGIYDGMSRGVTEARGKYVHVLNADDRFASSEVLSRVISRMEREQLDLHHSRANLITCSGRSFKTIGRDIDRDALLQKMRVAHPTVTLRKSIYQSFGTFSVGFRIAGDYEFLLRLWDRVELGYSEDVLVLMKYGGMSTSRTNIVLSHREAAAAAILHGKTPVRAAVRYTYEMVKSNLFPLGLALRSSVPWNWRESSLSVHPVGTMSDEG